MKSTKFTDSDQLDVRLPTCAGARRVGPYEPGKIYSVERKEAERLVRAKGFELVTGAVQHK